MSSSKKRRDNLKGQHRIQRNHSIAVLDDFIVDLKRKMNEVASKMAFDGLNQRDADIRRMWPRHHNACSDQNVLKPMGAYNGAAQCDCQNWGKR